MSEHSVGYKAGELSTSDDALALAAEEYELYDTANRLLVDWYAQALPAIQSRFHQLVDFGERSLKGVERGAAALGFPAIAQQKRVRLDAVVDWVTWQPVARATVLHVTECMVHAARDAGAGPNFDADELAGWATKDDWLVNLARKVRFSDEDASTACVVAANSMVETPGHDTPEDMLLASQHVRVAVCPKRRTVELDLVRGSRFPLESQIG